MTSSSAALGSLVAMSSSLYNVPVIVPFGGAKSRLMLGRAIFQIAPYRLDMLSGNLCMLRVLCGEILVAVEESP